MISPKESKALSVRLAMSVKACWSRPIAVLNGKERQVLRISTARKPRLLAHTSFCDVFFTQCTYAVYFFAETDGVFVLPLTFPFLSVQFRNTLRVCREISLPVSNDQRELRECVLFPTPPVGWACPSFQCLAQPLVRCTSAAFQPFLERTLRQSPHSFR